MRRFFLVFLTLVLLLTCLPAKAETEKAPCETREVVRLHVIADSDEPSAQALKLKVRDGVLAAAEEITRNARSREEALMLLRRETGRLRACARRAARNEGYDGEIRVMISREPFPARRYGGLLLRAGEYETVRVEIGSARGHNWWCVIYPSLCYFGTPAEGDGIYFYSSLRTWFRQIFGGGECA